MDGCTEAEKLKEIEADGRAFGNKTALRFNSYDRICGSGIIVGQRVCMRAHAHLHTYA